MIKKAIATLMVAVLTTGLLSIDVQAEDATKAGSLPGARSEYNEESGDVFLGGNYIEVGVSKGGSFGTAENPKDSSFHLDKKSSISQGKGIGLMVDGDGWNVGEEPFTGDFFLPGNPYESYIVSYNIDGESYYYSMEERCGTEWPSDSIQCPTVNDTSDVSKGKLSATVIGITKENVKVEIVYSFGVNDKFYSTDVKITNLGDKNVTNLSFKRDFDPDQDQASTGEYYTYDKVVCNPDKNKEGGEDNYSMVVSRGWKSFEGFFFVSFDNRAVAQGGGYYGDSLPTYATDESIALDSDMVAAGNTNGYRLDDANISITIGLNDLKPGESDTTSHYSSLDPNVKTSLGNILSALSATLKGKTDTSITVDVVEGYEYSIDGGKTWSDTGIFEGLEPGTEYTILSRAKATDTTEPGEIAEVTVSTKNEGIALAKVELQYATEDSIAVKAIKGAEYSIDGGKTWQDETVFEDLKPDTEYVIMARYKETEDTVAGVAVESLTVKTVEKTPSILDDKSNVSVKLEVVGENVPLVSVDKGSILEASSNDEVIAEAIENDRDIDIKLVIEGLEDANVDAEINELTKKALNSKQEIGRNFDLSIELLINSIFEKNIKELQKGIKIVLDVPEELRKEGRVFSVLRFHELENGKIETTIFADEDYEPNTVTFTTDRFSVYTLIYQDAPEAPTTPEVTVTDNQITVEAIEGAEYSIDGGKTWQDCNVFTDLEANTEYTVLVRYKANGDDVASLITSVTIMTAEAPAEEPTVTDKDNVSKNTTTDKNTNTGNTNTDLPQTGDNSTLMVYALFAMLSGVGFVLIGKKRKSLSEGK